MNAAIRILAARLFITYASSPATRGFGMLMLFQLNKESTIMTQTRFSLAVLIGITLSATILLSQTADAPKSEAYLLLGSPNRGAGEPIIFVNPKDANNMIVVAMATRSEERRVGKECRSRWSP